MHITFFETHQQRMQFYPIALTRPIAKIRIGIYTIAEKWMNYLNTLCHNFLTSRYLQEDYVTHKLDIHLYINSTILPNKFLVKAILALRPNQKLMHKNGILIAYLASPNRNNKTFLLFEDNILHLKNIQDCILLHDKIIQDDFFWKKKKSENVKDKNTVIYSKENIFIEKNVKIRAAVLDADLGPIYIDKYATVEPNSTIKGPVFIGRNTLVTSGTRVNSSTIGPFSKIGGEISNSIILGYSNKLHDGFLGHSIIGKWCNLGAGTCTSTMKNNYNTIKFWDYKQKKMIYGNMRFAGTLMGDYSKCGINTTLNIGTKIGVNVSIVNTQYNTSYVPSFTWITPKEKKIYNFDKAICTVQKTMERRNYYITAKEKNILSHIYMYR